MIKKLMVAIFVIVVASLSVSGCVTVNPSGTSSSSSPTPTADVTIYQTTRNPTAISTPKTDVASYLAERWEAGNTIVVRPFTKSTSERGNDVWKGVVRVTASTVETTVVTELVSSRTQAKQVFDATIADFQKKGYVYQPDRAAKYKSERSGLYEVWAGQTSDGYRDVMIYYDSEAPIGAWSVTAQTR